MAETINIGEIADKVSREIFRTFHWGVHPHTNDNFDCVHDTHTTASGGAKKSHPGDVVFYYHDPYLNKRIYLHTDLKSYKKGSVRRDALKDALHSLAWTIECANVSDNWKRRFCLDAGEHYEVRGLLFVANHDGQALDEFATYYKKVNRLSVELAQGQMIYVLGPKQITNLYSVATDIKLLRQDSLLPSLYHFYYPDLTLWKRQVADDARVPATLESLMAPYFVLKHGAIPQAEEQPYLPGGSIVYYARKGDTVDEFIYLIDALSRAQLVNARERIRVRVFGTECSDNLRSNFEQAKHKYCNLWRLSDERAQEIQDVTIDTVQRHCPNYSPAKIGWRGE